MASVVMVVSGANVWTMKNAKPHPTGFWAEGHRRYADFQFPEHSTGG